MFHYFNEEQIMVDTLNDKDLDIVPDDNIEKVNFPINTDMPYYTPTELIDNGILDKFNENIRLSDKFSLKDWFQNYWQECHGIYTADTKAITLAWKDKIRHLEYDISKSDGEEAEEKKKEMLMFGWNPSIPFSPENQVKAANRVSNAIDKDMYHVVDVTDDDIFPETISEDVDLENGPLKPIYIVLVKGKSMIGTAIRAVTRGEWSHACISLDNNMNKLYSFNLEPKKRIQGGFAKENIANFKNAKICVFCMLVKDDVYKKIKRAIDKFEDRANETTYNVINLFTILFNRAIDLDTSMVCSTFVDTILKIGNINITDKDSSLVSPMDLYKGAKKNKKRKIYKIFEDVCNKYNPNKIATKIKKLISKQTVAEGGLICEYKKIPVEFDREGNLLVKRSNKVNFDDEFNKSHRLLLDYVKSNNLEGMKYEISKLYYLNSLIERKLKKKKDKTLIDSRARILNDFNKYLIYITKADRKFNFIEYYNNSPFSNDQYMITHSTLHWTVEFLKKALKMA